MQLFCFKKLAFAVIPTLILSVTVSTLLCQETQERQQTESAEPPVQSSGDASISRPTSTQKVKDETPPDPVTEIEKELVARLIRELNAPVYKTRKNAERQLFALSERIEVILADLDPPSSLEARVSLRRVLRRIDGMAIIDFRWRVSPIVGKDDTLNVPIQTITFNEDFTFKQSKAESGPDETWSFDKQTGTLRMSFNDGYAIYTCKQNEHGDFFGKAKNIKNREWNFTLKRLRN
ncbi:MAG: hypothetical protein AB8B55_05895 [Mariniblastus sp.]